MSPCLRPLLGFGQVRHERLRPGRNAFQYPGYFLVLPMRAWARSKEQALPRNRFGLLSFFDRDHGDGGPDALAWLTELLRKEGVELDEHGEVWLQTYPRVLGYVFKPVSFWYCLDEQGRALAVVAEVNNTFGERHCYLITPRAGQSRLEWGQDYVARKVFHVSPFCSVSGQYRFRFGWSVPKGSPACSAPSSLVVRVDLEDEQGPLLLTSLNGRTQEVSGHTIRRALFGVPFMTLGVVARIHWQALKLWLKKTPFHKKPTPPSEEVTR